MNLAPPRYAHDCDRCRFIARCGNDDWYIHEGQTHTTILARYSNTDSGYWSMDTVALLDQAPDCLYGSRDGAVVAARPVTARHMLRLAATQKKEAP